ncbi:MAG: serine/threonine-protein kinase [Pseudomonadales bacterium]|nr:serine/threonine-protein kinase [Pseudomonadales bacterium]
MHYFRENDELIEIKKLGESLVAEVFMEKSEESLQLYLVKKVRSEFVSMGAKEHIEQQQMVLRQLNIENVTIPEVRYHKNQSLELRQVFHKGQLLRAWLNERWLTEKGLNDKCSTENNKPDITTVLEIGIALAESIALRHKAAYIHRAIKPNNIVIQKNPIRIQLLDDVRILDEIQVSQLIQNRQYQRETLPYVAPEQTGRVRVGIDYPCDLYSIGIVLYECLPGHPPLFYLGRCR